MNSQTLSYLQKDEIGKVLAKGLAHVYTHKPAAPIKYLAKWLQTYSTNQRELQKIIADEKLKTENSHVYAKALQVKQNVKAQEEKKLAARQEQISRFNAMVEAHQYHEELLHEVLPEFAEKFLGLTGVYIGYLDHPPQAITDEDSDENAHLNTAVPKLINYIGSSHSHRELMIGKTLPLDKGVTAAAFNMNLDSGGNHQAEDEVAVQPKEKYVYVPNVVKNENVHYFRLPKLGCYLAIPLVYNSYLTEHIFDVALGAKLKDIAAEKEFNKTKHDNLQEAEHEITELEKKLFQLTEKNGQAAAIEAAKAQLADSVQKIQQIKAETFTSEAGELTTEKKEYVFCADTLGSDTVISEQNRDFLVNIVKHFVASWKAKEKHLLDKDVNLQIDIKSKLVREAALELEHLDKCEQIPPETKAEIDQLDEEHREYKTEQCQFHRLRQAILQQHRYMESFVHLSHFRVVNFKGLIQQLLFLLKYKKAQINLPGKTVINWKQERVTHINADTFKKILGYVVEGPKTEVYPSYCKAPVLLQKLDHFNEEEVFQYNIGLGAIFKFAKKALALRLSNVERRKAHKEQERQKRADIVEENEHIAEEKRQALDKHKSTLTGEQLESFKEDEWSQKYDHEFPIKEIPQQVVDDIDNDV